MIDQSDTSQQIINQEKKAYTVSCPARATLTLSVYVEHREIQYSRSIHRIIQLLKQILLLTFPPLRAIFLLDVPSNTLHKSTLLVGNCVGIYAFFAGRKTNFQKFAVCSATRGCQNSPQ